MGFRELAVGKHVKIWGAWHADKEHENSVLHPIPCPVHLFSLAVPKLYPFIKTKNLQSSKLLSVSHSNKLNLRKGWLGISLIHSPLIRSTGDNLDL